MRAPNWFRHILVPVRSAPVGKLMLRGPLVWKLLAPAALLAGCLDTGYVLSIGAQGGEAGQGGSAGPATSGASGTGQAGADSLPPAPGCEQSFQPGVDFAVCRARAWGSDGQAQLLATAIDREGFLLLGGETLTVDPAVPTLSLAPGATGVLERTDTLGQPSALVRLANKVNDLALLDDSVLVATDLGLTRLSSNLQGVLDDQAIGEVLRVAASADMVLTLGADGRARSFDANLTEQSELPLAGVTSEDVAVDQATGLRVVTGAQLPPATSQCQGTLPFIRAYNAQSELVWSAYDAEDPLTWCASSTGRRLEIKQGKLYYAGEQHGGNSVHLRDPRDPSAQAALVSYDEFSTGAGKAIAIYSFVARFDLATGAFETGQVIVPREAGVGGALSTSALAVDDAGRIFLGGQLSCCIEHRDERRVAGTPLGPYAGPEASLLVLSADLRERLSWTSFTAGAGPDNSAVRAIAVGSGVGVVGATLDGAAALISAPEEKDTKPPSGGYLVTFPAP